MGPLYFEENIEFARQILLHRKNLSDKEVVQWLEQKDHRKLLDEVAALKRNLEKHDFHDLQAAELLRLQKAIRLHSIRRHFRKISTIAAALIVLGWGLWLQLSSLKTETAQETASTLEIRPGSIRAQLILGNGREIELGSTTTPIQYPRVNGIVNDSIKGLDYSQAIAQESKKTPEYHILKVPVGGFYKVELPDGTKVWLNADSELKFPVSFNTKKREVYLRGEGYFQVVRDTNRQFIVHLRNSAVTVLGTVFNISAYDNEERIYTTLLEGGVTFYSQKIQQQLLLQPGMQSSMDIQTGKTSIAYVDPSVYTAWVKGKFIFRMMNLETIMRQLQRWYDFEVFYQYPQAKQYEFRGVISRDMSIQKVLDMIEETTNLKFQIQDRTVVIKQ